MHKCFVHAVKPPALHSMLVQEMKKGWPKPYILGGRPPGAQWDAPDKVAEYCSFDSEGQVLPQPLRSCQAEPQHVLCALSGLHADLEALTTLSADSS